MSEVSQQRDGVIGGVVRAFISRNLSVLLILFALAAGMGALLMTPREEDPQIVVPMADVFVRMPGFSAGEVERLVATRLEKLLYQIDGVEYVYSMSKPNLAVVTVRFYVGEDREDSLIRLYNKIQMNVDFIPPGVTGWVVKPVEIDDVPILCATLFSRRYKEYELRRVAEELEIELQAIPDTGVTRIVGGLRRRLNVRLDAEAMAAHGLQPLDLSRALAAANVTLRAGSFDSVNREQVVDAGDALARPEDVMNLVVGVHESRPVYLRDVARVSDGSDEIDSYTRFGFGPAADPRWTGSDHQASPGPYPSVTIAVAKKKGANAISVSRAVQARLEELRSTVLPDGMDIAITRDYGRTANDKVNDLVESLIVAGIIVAGLILFSMGWREAFIVVTAVPITFSLSLLVNYLAGYTINRVTLFALILSLGLVVDDPITNVDNIQRHIRMRLRKPLDATIAAVQEVLPPVILSTLAIIVSFTPMFFITGMMGPYMRPMAINVPLAVTFSTVCALTIVPWLSYYLLRKQGESESAETVPRDVTPAWLRKSYSRIMRPFLSSSYWRFLLLAGTVVLFFGAVSLAALGLVPLKMLPFDNKNELQIVVDMPEGTTLERTAEATDAIAGYLPSVPEMTDYTTYVGLSSPMDFNGLVRHYYLREGSNVSDIRVNLIDKYHREQQSHAIALRIRKDIEHIAERFHANVKIVEIPPGPPVIATITAEIYGAPYSTYQEMIEASGMVRDMMAKEPLLVDLDVSVEFPQTLYVFKVDKVKAALNGVSTEDIARTVQMALGGADAGVVHLPHEANPFNIYLQLPMARRSTLQDLKALYVRGNPGVPVQIAELGLFTESTVDQTIYHKNLRRLVYIYGELAGRPPAEAIFSMQRKLERNPLPEGFQVEWTGEGEWKITVDVFRDLGIAFAVAFLGIYILLVYETRSYLIPCVLLIAVPLTIIGIMPGFWLLNAVTGGQVGGYPNPIFFTATAMIGTIALAGIVVRNSVVLITFIRDELAEGQSLEAAILSSGAVRMRPIFLTAATTALSAWPITLAPIFSGLAWALIFGLFVSTAFSLVMVPVVYFMIYRKRFGTSGAYGGS
ncbi:MAG: efflux RND transporter permease subunit [Deltaproteobacteria bacterium]|nr:efflux RND transporter permease subunit [Deltaproteobacteria bacterium]